MADDFEHSKLDLEILKSYLKIRHGINVGKVALVHDKEMDARNGRDPRAFCYTLPNSLKIHCALALEMLPDEARLGVILHELGHIHLKAFGRDAEIKVDEWITGELPEFDYRYKYVIYYVELSCGAIVKRVARSLETISKTFLKNLMREASRA